MAETEQARRNRARSSVASVDSIVPNPARCTPECVLPRPYSAAQHCMVCHRTFPGPSAADRHRTGRHGLHRRCMTDQEMIGAGLAYKPERGMWGWAGNRPETLRGDAVEPRCGEDLGSSHAPE